MEKIKANLNNARIYTNCSSDQPTSLYSKCPKISYTKVADRMAYAKMC